MKTAGDCVRKKGARHVRTICLRGRLTPSTVSFSGRRGKRRAWRKRAIAQGVFAVTGAARRLL